MPSLSSKFTIALFVALLLAPLAAAQDKATDDALDWLLPRAKLRMPFAKEQPITFVTVQNFTEWSKLPAYWNPVAEVAIDPATGAKVQRQAVKIKLPLGLSQAPRVPEENPMTVARWELGRQLYFDKALSSDGNVACASCHDPKMGFTDQMPVSAGISGLKGGVSAPTVMNSAYNILQFWDGRALSLEDQAQGPVQNPVEMFDGKQHAWDKAVLRLRKKGDYSRRFKEAFGTDVTREAVAQAIATYERTVLNGNSIHDRADRAMRVRVAEEEGTDFTIKTKDYEKALKEAFAKKDTTALSALGAAIGKDEANVAKLAESINQGRALFFGKARCSLCHVGDNFTDNTFHNLGVGVDKAGKLPHDGWGRFMRLPLGHKNPEMVGAFKTPTLRGLVSTAPYMHTGSERTLLEVVEFYDRGGNANEYLDPKMRDLEAEKRYIVSKRTGTEYKGPPAKLFDADDKVIIPSPLNLTAPEKTALVMFMRALEGEVDALVMDPAAPVPGNKISVQSKR